MGIDTYVTWSDYPGGLAMLQHVTFFRTVLGSLALLLIWTAAQADAVQVLYVDRDSICPGRGTSQEPYCSIQQAFDRVTCGQRIRIRQSERPYDENAVAHTPSCTEAERIIVEPDTGHTPILRYSGNGSPDGAIELRDVDHWTVQHLTFDGRGVSTSDTAIEIAASTRAISGVHLLHNTIRNWGLTPLDNRAVRAIYVHGNRQTGVTANHVVIRHNTLTQIRTNAMRIEGTQHAIIEDNTLSQLKCGWHTADSFKHEAIKITSGQTRSRSPSNGTLIRRNHIHDFQSLQACLAEYGPAAGRPVFRGIYCDVNADDGRVVGNLIHTMSPGLTQANLTRGIYIESRCDRWEVSENIVYDVAGVCFRISASGHTVKLTNNVCYNAGLGIDYRGHDEVTITNNIIYLTRPKARVIRLDQRAVNAPYRIDHNLYFNRAAPLTFRHGKNNAGPLLWKLLCQCDVHSQNAAPQFIHIEPHHKDFHLQPSSPARRAGTAGVDIGAYP